MNETKNLADDPKLTAYALGELEGDERAEVEAALRSDPAARAAVEEIRATAARLEAALEAEPLGEVEPMAATDPYRPAKQMTLLRFPRFYFVVGGLAAACFAVFVAVRAPQHEMREEVQKQYREVKLAEPVPVESVNLPVAEATPVAASTAAPAEQVRGAGVTAFAVPTSLLDQAKENAAGRKALEAPLATTFKADQKAPRTDWAVTRAKASSTGEKPWTHVYPQDDKFVIEAQPAPKIAAPPAPAVNEAVVLSPFEVTTARSAGSVGGNTLAGTRVRTDLKDVAASVAVMPQQFLQETGAGNSQGLLRSTAKTEVGGLAINQPNTEAYAYRAESDFLSAAENPRSTFSADVDTASYANVRRLLERGQRPPADAVRIEELLNYFPYQYAGPAAGKRGEGAASPSAGVPFAATMEVAEAPWAAGHRLVRIGLKGREVAASERGPANLVFLLDVSGSMNEPNKLPLVQESMKLLLGRLRPDDRVAIVVYAGASGLALPSTPVAKARDITEAIEELRAGGSTNGAMGIQLAYDIAKANFASGGINRVILCTDGDFNVGVTSEGGLVRLIQEKAKSGVFLTVLGFGMGNYKDATLQQLADAGNGNYGYIDTRREAEKLLVEQVNGTLVTIAKDVKLQVEFNPARVARYRLIGYEKRLLKQEDFNNDKVDAGEIGAGHAVTALYEIVPVGSDEPSSGAGPEVDGLKYQRHGRVSASVMWSPGPGTASSELLTLKVRYKEPAGEVSRKLEFPLVDRGEGFAAASADFKFAAAVAEFGMILRDSPHKGAATLADVAKWAAAGAGNDPGGYRAEFLGLVARAEALMP